MAVAMSAIFIYWITYVISSMLLFFIVAFFINNSNSIFILSSVIQNDRARAITIIAVASMAGIPPFMGFWTKTAILFKISASGDLFLTACAWLLAIIALLFYFNALRCTTLTSVDLINQKYLFNFEFTGTHAFLLFFIIFGFLFMFDFIIYSQLLFY